MSRRGSKDQLFDANTITVHRSRKQSRESWHVDGYEWIHEDASYDGQLGEANRRRMFGLPNGRCRFGASYSGSKKQSLLS